MNPLSVDLKSAYEQADVKALLQANTPQSIEYLAKLFFFGAEEKGVYSDFKRAQHFFDMLDYNPIFPEIKGKFNVYGVDRSSDQPLETIYTIKGPQSDLDALSRLIRQYCMTVNVPDVDSVAIADLADLLLVLVGVDPDQQIPDYWGEMQYMQQETDVLYIQCAVIRELPLQCAIQQTFPDLEVEAETLGTIFDFPSFKSPDGVSDITINLIDSEYFSKK